GGAARRSNTVVRASLQPLPANGGGVDLGHHLRNRDVARPKVLVAAAGCRVEGGFVEVLGVAAPRGLQQEHAAGAQTAVEQAENPGRVGQVFEHVDAYDEVESCLRNVMEVDVAQTRVAFRMPRGGVLDELARQ